MSPRTGIVVVLLLLVPMGCGEQEKTSFQREVETEIANDRANRSTTWQTLDKSPRTVDVAGRRRYEWAKRPPEILDEAGLYLLHILLERPNDADARADAVLVIARIKDDAQKVQERLLQGTLEGSGCDPETRQLLAQALATFPRPLVGLEAVRSALEEALHAGDRVLCRSLLVVWSQRARRLPSQTRNQAVEDVAALEDLALLVGDTYRLQRIALVGGRSATQHVLTYLLTEKNPRTNRWAVDVAGRLEWPVEVLDPTADPDDPPVMFGDWLFYAMDRDQLPEQQRTQFSDDAVTRRQAVNACRDMVARYAKSGAMGRKYLGDIQAHVNGLGEAGFSGDPHLLSAFQRLQQELQAALDD